MRISVFTVFVGTFLSNVLMITMLLDDNLNDIELQQKMFDPKHAECVKKYLNHTVLAEEINVAMTENTMPLFMQNNCPKWQSAVECYDTFAEELKPHLNFLQRMALQSMKGMIKSSIAFICENNGERFLDFIDWGGLECLIENHEKMRDCLTVDSEEEFLNMVNTEEDDALQLSWKPTTFTGQECKVLLNITDCLLNEVQQSCSNKSHVFLNDFISGLLQKTPCGGVLAGMSFIEWEHYLLAVLLPKHIPVKDRICTNNFTALEVAQQNMQNASKCWNGVIDNSFLWEDAKAAFEHRTFVSFLKKYCPKMQSLSMCVGDYLDSLQQCVSGEDSVTLGATKDVVEGSVNFLCHRDGERILLFMKEDGMDCLEKQQESIRQCVENAGVHDLFQSADGDMNPMEVLNNLWVPQNYRPEECRVIVSLEVCVYKNMKQCKRRAPANLISSLIRAVARRSPCWKIERSFGNEAFSLVPTVWMSTVAVGLLALQYYFSRSIDEM